MIMLLTVTSDHKLTHELVPAVSIEKTGNKTYILALTARDSTILTGGPNWEVPLGRRDSRSASLSGSNNNIPSPKHTFDSILSRFKRQGLDLVDLVALSGTHIIGNSRCTGFRQRLYNQLGNNKPDSTLDDSYATQLHNKCRTAIFTSIFIMFLSPINVFIGIFFGAIFVLITKRTVRICGAG
ncbi:Peroxidase 72 [Capsicum baccatum]|uniref:peroxidase n=1 Tax=Capsicum baccatum TaxID=33114 RepID=A0A2G2WTG4_CAPBA|nr:Peroxidase 72 [Capsicum baccatum]